MGLLRALQGPSRPKGSGAETRPAAPSTRGAVPSFLRRAGRAGLPRGPGSSRSGRLTLPLALPLHHDVPVQRPGHGVGKLGALQERGHGAAGGARAAGARLCHLLPDGGPGLSGGGRSGAIAPGPQRPKPARSRPPPGRRRRTPRVRRRAGVSGLGAARPPPARRPLPTRLLCAFSAAPARLGFASHPAARADSFRSRGGRRPRGSGAGKGGSGRDDGCRRRPNPVTAAGAPGGAGPGRAGAGAARERDRGRGARSGTAFIGCLETRVRNNCTETRLPRARPPRRPAAREAAARRGDRAARDSQ